MLLVIVGTGVGDLAGLLAATGLVLTFLTVDCCLTAGEFVCSLGMRLRELRVIIWVG